MHASSVAITTNSTVTGVHSLMTAENMVTQKNNIKQKAEH